MRIAHRTAPWAQRNSNKTCGLAFQSCHFLFPANGNRQRDSSLLFVLRCFIAHAGSFKSFKKSLMQSFSVFFLIAFALKDCQSLRVLQSRIGRKAGGSRIQIEQLPMFIFTEISFPFCFSCQLWFCCFLVFLSFFSSRRWLVRIKLVWQTRWSLY